MRALHLATAVLLLAAPLVGCQGNGTEVDTPRLDGSAPPRSDGGTPDGCEPTTVYADTDGDGHGNASDSEQVCGTVPEGFVTIANDCDDSSAAISPVSPEVCDGSDNDCDGLVDEDLDEVTMYRDEDGDGFGGRGATTVTCGEAPEGFVPLAGDCNDSAAAIHPEALETCNTRDDDCDFLVDEEVLEIMGDATFLGDVESGFRQVSLASFSAGYVAAWTDPAGRISYAVLGPGGSVVEGPAPVDPTVGVEQTHPVIAVRESGDSAAAVVAWSEDATRIQARRLALNEQATSTAPVTLSAADETQRLPVEPAVSGDLVIVPWLASTDPGETRARIFGVDSGLPIGEEIVLHVSSRVEPDNFGPSVAVLPSDPDVLYLGVIDRMVADERTVGYVHRFALPALTEIGVPRRLEPHEGAARRVLLVPGGDPPVLLGFVAHGMQPDEETDVFRIEPESVGAFDATRIERPATGLVLTATRSLGGADVVLSDVTMERRELRIGLCSPEGEHYRADAVARLLSPWASMTRLHDLEGAVLYTGRVSESDVEPGVWLQRYGCSR